jgi:hypothetical protein
VSVIVPALLGLLVVLETLGRMLYPLSREARSKREAARDHRRDLSYLGAGGEGRTVLRDLYLMEKRYLPFLGWIGAPNVRLATVETNAQGFRDSTIEPRSAGEYRVLVTGGSFAWGVGASCNACSVTGQLERLLNQQKSERRCRVMNGAFLNWSSRHEYVVVTEFFDTFDPDLVISLSGYNDLVALSKGVEIDALPEAQLLGQAVSDHMQPMGTLRAMRKLAGTLGVWRIVVLLREARAARTALRPQSYAYDFQGGFLRVERLVQRYLSIADFLARKGRRYLIALEPEIYSSRKALTLEEFDLKNRFLEIDRNILPTLTRYRRELGVALAGCSGGRFAFLDLADVFDNETQPVFIDYNHVCDRGNALVAKALADALRKVGSRSDENANGGSRSGWKA